MADTIFCDIDGTILFQGEKSFTEHYRENEYSKSLHLSAEKTFEWHVAGHKIILTTARPESTRDFTERELASHGIVYDMLLMGIGAGKRYLINDRDEKGNDKAFSINLDRNTGIGNISI